MASLSLRHLTHAFGSHVVLKNVNLSINAGEIVGILGENGAGKSTLLNLLSGTLQPANGGLLLDDQPVSFSSYHQANLCGVWRIFQDPALIGNLPVFESLFLGHEQRFSRFGVLNKREMIRQAQRLVASMALAVDVRAPMLSYDFATRQALEVARAVLLPQVLNLPAGFVLFDEPSTGLSRAEVSRLLTTMRQLRDQGAGVAFVSHRLQEVFEVCDRLVILKDGAVVSSGPIATYDETRIHSLMVGRDIAPPPLTVRAEDGRPLALMVQQLSSGHSLRGSLRRAALQALSFRLQQGEIVGVGGLLGSGKGQLLRVLAGVEAASSGEVTLYQQPLTGAVGRRKRQGVAFVPGDRPHEALILSQSVAANISLPSGQRSARGFSRFGGLWRSGYEREVARQLIRALRIKTTSGQAAGTLSGGNQQKVSLARWIHRQPRLLLIENPTAGVDVGAKADIYALLRQLAAEGTTILYVTDDLPELLTLSSRILIMRDGQLVTDIPASSDRARESVLVAEMIGAASAAASA